ncbi:Box C/D snoRNA protein 1 [Mortierella sp. AM989]|nr:Box C/D snoRNA protein 1 [Mortierella sp. AM989]
MDFFSNAFITRDVVEEDNMVVKDGIQVRENAISSLSNDIVNCEVCGITTAKYKCPGCFCQTCSLKCSKQHKLDTTCSGIRSRTHFVERKQYSEQDMMSDYNFLEEVGRTVDNAARDNLKRDSGLNPNKKRILGANNNNKNNKRGRNQHNKDGAGEGEEEENSVTKLSLTAAQELEKQGSEGSGSYRDKQLIMQAKKRAIHLIRMADGLKKRKENNTHWRDKPSRILWTIEWLFPEINSSRRILEHKNEESKSLKDVLAGVLVKEDSKDLLEKYPIDLLEQCQLFFVIPLRHANQPALYPLKNTDSLQEALKFKKVLEYPTILVLGPTSSTCVASPTATTDASGSTEAQNNADQAKSVDPSHPILKRYTIEEPPTQWPKRAINASETQQGQQGNRKRRNDTTAESVQDAKKAKLDGEELEDGDAVEITTKDEEEEESSEDSDSDSSSDSDSDSDDSSSEESDADSDDGDGDDDKDKNDGNSSKIQAAGETNELVAADEPDLKFGQAILEAFSKDFGEAE